MAGITKIEPEIGSLMAEVKTYKELHAGAVQSQIWFLEIKDDLLWGNLLGGLSEVQLERVDL